MGSFTQVFILFLICSTQGSAAIQWSSSSPKVDEIIHACAGDPVTFDWEFTLDATETLEDIQWFSTNGRSNQLLALFDGSDFSVMPTFSQRVRRHGNGGILLNHVVAEDAGNFSVQVNFNSSAGPSRSERTVLLQTAAPPVSKGGVLTLTQDRAAVTDHTTGEQHVQLSCGSFMDLGQPPVTVVWQTPNGSFLTSSGYDGHRFNLLLENPVTEGNYSCRLSPSSPAVACLHGNDTLLEKVRVTVDEVMARLTLTEARQDMLEKSVWKEREDLKNQVGNLTDYVHSLESQLDHYREAAGRQVSFHAKLTYSTPVADNEHVIPDMVISNQGGAYNSTTGEFTAPYNGTYFFIAGGPPDRDTGFWWYLMLDVDTILCLTVSRYGPGVQRPTCHAVRHLTEGQSVWLKSGGSPAHFYAYTYFSGFLVNADQ